MPASIAIVMLDPSTGRGLVDSAYNERRSRCEEAARCFGVKALRDINIDEFERKSMHESGLSNIVLKRARHIITENARVLEAIETMIIGNVKHLGELFNASHNSLRDDFEVTNDALNFMVECARMQDGSYGGA